MIKQFAYTFLAVASMTLIALPGLAGDKGAKAPDADNTKQNEADYKAKKPTADNQSNNKDSVKKIAKLRRAIMKTKGLSVNAQNVKIIDENGHVFLRGPVDSAKEKDALETIAKKQLGDTFTNELEVKESTN
jgi:Putative phospholipid-binding domain.